MYILERRWLEIFPALIPLMERYRSLENRIQQLKDDIGVDCLPGCGSCCTVSTVEIESGSFELLPAAVWLWQQKRAEQVLAALQQLPADACCFFYTPGLDGFGGGHCSIYPYRPLLCRMFGFTAVPDKYGAPSYTFCRQIKDHYPEQVVRLVAGNRCAPLWMRAESSAVLDLDPRRELPLTPLNQAAAAALERVLYRAELYGFEPSDDDQPPEDLPPLFPRCA